MRTKRKTIGQNVVDTVFDSTVFTMGEIVNQDDNVFTMEVKSALDDRSTFDIVWFRILRLGYGITDMYIVGDDDNGLTHYEFWLESQ